MRAVAGDAEASVTRDGVTVHYAALRLRVAHAPAPPDLVAGALAPLEDAGPLPGTALHRADLRRAGSGRSDRPASPASYSAAEFAADALAVMDATETERAVLVSVSRGALWSLELCAEHPERVLGAIFIAPTVPFAIPPLERVVLQRFDEVVEDPAGWEKYNAHHWKADYRDFVEFFVGRMFTEPHSTKQHEDAVGWALETDPATLIATQYGLDHCTPRAIGRLLAKVRCPVLVIHGSHDAVRIHAQGASLAERTGGTLVTLEGSGHFPHTRDPVRVNLLIRQFVEGIGR